MEQPVRFVVTRDDALPALAWCAELDLAGRACRAEVGRFVEVDPEPTPRWIAAGVWDGDFGEGDLDRADHVFGSGLRFRDGEVHVVPAHTMVDRCLYARDGARWVLSNSLVVLLGRTGARLDTRHDHRPWGESACLGIANYVRQIPVVHPRFSVVHQVMWEQMSVGLDGSLRFRRTDPCPGFATFDAYVGACERTISALWANARDARRRRPMRAVTSASRGYDSTAVTALVTSVVGPLPSWTARQSNTRLPPLLRRVMRANVADDDGTGIARRLVAEPRYLDADLGSLSEELEAWCWAGAQTSPELVFAPLLEDAERQETPTLFFAGHNGDAIWGTDPEAVTAAEQGVRSAPSGVSLADARVRYGVVDVSVPFLFARSAAAINAISRSAEMAPWRLGTPYDRPIPRRLLEQRGVPRDEFGFGKKAVADDFESPRGVLRAAFFERSGWNRAGERAYRGLNLGIYLAGRALDFLHAGGDRAVMMRTIPRFQKRTLRAVADLQRATFAACTDLLASRYAPLAAPAPAPLRASDGRAEA